MSNHPSVPPSSSPPTTPPSNNDSQPPLNLKYHVIQCSSEDSNHPCTNLHSYNIHSQGWQSSSYCDYPQSMTIQFEGQVRLKRIKILSHEYKISSKIELFIGVQSDDDEDNDDDTHNNNNNNNNNNNLHENNSNNNESHKNCETNNNNILSKNNNYTTVENNNAKKWLRLLSHHDHDSDDSFKRIGFLSLSNNEKSGYSARELKKVKLDVRCTCMKLVFHSNFVNKKNIFNQIGIVGMQFIGQVLSMFPSNALNPIIIHHHNNGNSSSNSNSNSSSRSNSRNNSSSSRNKSNIPQKPLPLPTIIGQSSNNVIPGTSDYSSIMLDEETQIRIEELTILKSRAVQEEDFMRAQSIKDQIDLLKQASIQLSELEKQKLIAIEREDYVRAHRLKQEMISIRSNILERRDGGGGGSGGVPSHQQQPVSTPPPFTNNHHNTSNNHNHLNNNVVASSALSSSENDSEQETDANTAIITTTTMDHSVSPPPPPPQQQQQQRKRNVLSSDEEEQRVFNTNNSAWVDPNVPFDNRPIKPMNTNQMFSPPSPPENLKNDLQVQTTMAAKDTSDNNPHALRKKRSKRVDPNVDHSKHQVQQPNSYDEKPIQGLNENALESDENESMKSQKRQNLIPESIENTILANMEEWERAIARRIIEECSDRMVDPGPLPKNDKFIDIVEVFGDYVTRCLLSQKSRGLRESSVLVLTQNLEQLPHDKIMIVMGALSFLKIGLKDKIPAIYHANIEFLKQVIKFGSKAVKRSHIASCMEPVLSILATKISDSNSRTRDAAEKTLQFLSTRASVGASSVCDSCLKIPKDEQAGWKPVVARTNMIIFLTKKYGFSDKSGLNTQKVSNIITKGLNNPNVEARKAALELYLESFKVDPSIQHLSIQYEKSKPILYREMIEITSRKEDEYSHEPIVEVSDDPPSRGTPTKRKRKATKQSDTQNKQEEEPPKLDQQVISSFECLNPEEMHGCDFCGEKFPDDTFVNWHWMFYCRLLTPCPLCVQIVMIEQFNYHLETECEKREAVQFCQKCDEPVVPDHQDVHDSYCQPRPQNSAIRCPLCKVDFTDHFYEHLFEDQCQNIRADPRESGAEFDDMYHQWMHYREEHNIK